MRVFQKVVTQMLEFQSVRFSDQYEKSSRKSELSKGSADVVEFRLI